IVLVIAHAAGALLFDDDAGRDGMGAHVQVGARQHRRQISLGGAAALTVLVRDLIAEGTELIGAVVVRRFVNTLAGTGGDAQPVAGTVVARCGDIERAAAAVVVVLAIDFAVFRAAEVGQHLAEGPAVIAQRRPVVVVPAVAAHIDHAVDRTAAAQCLAAWL